MAGDLGGDEIGCLRGESGFDVTAVRRAVIPVRAHRVGSVAQVDRLGAVQRARRGESAADPARGVPEDRDRGDVEALVLTVIVEQVADLLGIPPTEVDPRYVDDEEE